MNDITLYEKMPNPVEAVERLGIMMAKSGMFGCDNENAGKVLAMICMTERKSPVEIIRTYDIIGGKLRKKALASYAEFRARGGRVKWIKTGEDGLEARAMFTFEDQSIESSFTIDQAKKADASFKPGSNWTKTPANMLRARCLSNAIAMLCPEIFAGGDDDSEVLSSPAVVIDLKPQVEAQIDPRKNFPAPHNTASQPPAAPPPAVTQATDISTAVPIPAEKSVDAQPSAPAAASLPPEIVSQLEAVCGEHAVAAGKWLLAQNPPWLLPGQGLEHLTPQRAANIIKNSARFIRAITKITL